MPGSDSAAPSRLGDLTFTELEQRDTRSLVLVVPLGSTEQHGPHLPLSTDTDLAVALCDRLAARRTDVVVAPVVAYGASGEHAGFAGTLSIGTTVLTSVVVELVRSATETFDRVLLVSSHGGNAAAVTAAAQQLVSESRDVRVFAPTWSGDLHAGHAETSMMLALDADRIRADRVAVGNTGGFEELWPQLRAHGVRSVSPSGVLGDPTTATAVAGVTLLDRLADELTAVVDSWTNVTAGATR